MSQVKASELRSAWETGWAHFDEMLNDLGRSQGCPWDPWALAVFIDVPAFSLTGILPAAREAGLTKGFDLVQRVRDGIRRAMKELWDQLVDEADDPLRLEWGLTGLLLTWEWLEMESAGEDPSGFFERLRELRLRMPEVVLCERTVHQFCLRVPPPRIRSARGP